MHDFDKEEIECIKLGNYNLLCKKLLEKKVFHLLEDRVKKILKNKNLKDVVLHPNYSNLLKIESISCPHNLIIPLTGKNQGGLLFPDFQYVVFTADHSLLKKIHCEISMKNAYNTLLPLLWILQPLLYLEKENFQCKFTLPGGIDCNDEIDGRSAGLGCLIAMLTSITGLKLTKPFAITGTLDENREEKNFSLQNIKVCKVGGISGKVEAILRERPDIEKILIPQENEEEYQALQDKSKVCMVSTVEEALLVCFGENWKENANPIKKEIRYHDEEEFFARARNVQDKSQARKLYFHLEEHLQNKKDAASRNILCWTLHRIGNTYRFDPAQKKEYLQKSLELFQEIQQESMVSDIREELKLYTSYCDCMRKSLEYSKAEAANERLMQQFSYGDYNRMPNLSIQGQISMAKGDYEKAEKAFDASLEIAIRAKDIQSILDYKSNLLFLYMLWHQWGKGAEIYREIQNIFCTEDTKFLDPKKKDKIEIKQREFLGWATVYNVLGETFQEEKKTTLEYLLGKKERGHRDTFILGLLHIAEPVEACKDFKKSENDCKNQNKKDYPYKDLWSIPALVCWQYANSLQKGKPVVEKKCIERIQKVIQESELNDIEEPLKNHLSQWTQIGESLEALRDWCFGLRRWISST